MVSLIDGGQWALETLLRSLRVPAETRP